MLPRFCNILVMLSVYVLCCVINMAQYINGEEGIIFSYYALNNLSLLKMHGGNKNALISLIHYTSYSIL